MGVIRQYLQGTNLVRPGLGTDINGDEAGWYRWFSWFEIVFGGITALAIGASFLDDSIGQDSALAGSVAALFLVGWYMWRGRWGRIHTNLDALLYFVPLLLALPFSLRMYDGFGLLIFAAYWQGFAMMRTGPAVVYAAILTVAIQFAYSSITLTNLSDIRVTPWQIIVGLVMLLVTGMMAMYMESLAREVDRRQQLLRELRAAQEVLAEQERAAGIREERERLSAEIHDTIAQHFTSIVTNLTAAEARVDHNPTAARNHVSAAIQAARQGITDSRRMVRALQPEILSGRTVSQALRKITMAAQGGNTGRVRYVETGEAIPMNRLHEAILVRALQEALGNIHKHANAASITVTVTWEDGDMILDISDNGPGFTPTEVRPSDDGHQMGLTTMRTRVENAGGTWMLESSPGEGTSLAISFPVARDGTEEAT